MRLDAREVRSNRRLERLAFRNEIDRTGYCTTTPEVAASYQAGVEHDFESYTSTAILVSDVESCVAIYVPTVPAPIIQLTLFWSTPQCLLARSSLLRL